MDEPFLRIRANQIAGFVDAHEGDCVHLKFTSTVHSPVRRGISDTVTTMPGEVGVVIRRPTNFSSL